MSAYAEAVNNGIKLVQSILNHWWKGQPERERKHNQKEATHDLNTLNTALCNNDAAALAEYFEAERTAALLSVAPQQLHPSEDHSIEQNPSRKP